MKIRIRSSKSGELTREFIVIELRDGNIFLHSIIN